MASDQLTYDYIARDAAGRRVKGSLAAKSDGAAFEQLKRQGFAPLTIRPARSGSRVTNGPGKTRRLNDREAAELLSDLAALLKAGSGIRAALSVITAKSDRASVRSVCKDLLADVSSGMGLEQAFSRGFAGPQAFVPALVATGEASGDLAGGLERTAEMLASQVKLRDQLVSALAYPAFVLLTSVFAMMAILLFVIPSLAPLLDQPGVDPPPLMRLMVGASTLLHQQALAIGLIAAAAAAGLAISAKLGTLTTALDRLLLDGPFRRTAGALVFGGFAVSLGAMLSAGAPMADALRLAIRGVRSAAARRRLEPITHHVRQGAALSDVLTRVQGFPLSVVRLAAIGEASGGLGPMISRAGHLEETSALRRIEAMGRMIGPALIVGLGGLIGLMMGGLLSGVTQIGNSALQ